MKKTFIAISAILASLSAFAQFDIYGTCTVTTLAAPKIITANTTNAGVDVHDYIGTPVLVLCYTNTLGTNSTLAVKVQDSADDTTYADVSGSAFSLVTNTTAQYQGTLTIGVTPGATAKYIRTVQNISGTSTPTFETSVVLIGRKKYN